MGNERYEVQNLLGRGGMGSVYAAFDRRRQRRVAMKVMRDSERASLYRFKREFRAIAHLRHPNLVRLYDLGVLGDGRFFFTMELVEGVPLGASVGTSTEEDGTTGSPLASTIASPSGSEPRPPADLEVLGVALVGLVEGLWFLHAAQRVHRDLKPSNVMIDESGQARVLDFGIVRELDTAEGWTVHGTVGTPYYMAPEQVSGAPVTPAADLYALGCILYELLAGQPPFLGSGPQVLSQHLHQLPLPPSKHRPCDDVLEDLALTLLQKEPARRPGAESTLEALQQRFGLHRAPLTAPPRPRPRPTLVGRNRELARLRTLYREAKESARIVLVEGESGVGKSALAAAFSEELRPDGAEGWFGNCYEREQVPYQAFDTIVDRAVSTLVRRPRDAYRWLPPDTFALSQLFPVVREVPAATELVQGAGGADPEGNRQRAARSLIALLTNLGDGEPPLLVLDDLHRAGSDSLDLLSWIIEGDNVPPCLVVATLRPGEGRRDHRLFSHPRTETIALDALSDEDASSLIEACVPVAISPAQRARLVADSGGNAFLALELARGVFEEGGEKRLPGLGDVVRRRVEGAGGDASGALEVIAAAGGATPFSVLQAATGLSSAVLAEAVDELLDVELLQEAAPSGDAYRFAHDRLREAAYESLSSDRRRTLHRTLAEHLAQEGDAARAVEHWRLAGDRVRARDAAIAAGRQAEEQLAYGRAAELYGLAAEEDPTAGLQRRLGSVLARAGRHLEAAEVLARVASKGGEDAREVALQAAVEHIAGGDLQGGIETFESLLRPFGEVIRIGGFRALASVLLRTARLLAGWFFDDLRGPRQRRPRSPPIEPDIHFRLRLYQAIADHLQWHLPLVSADYGIKYALLARRVGGLAELGRARLRTVTLLVGVGDRFSRRVIRHLEAGEALCADVGDHLGLLQGQFARAYMAMCEGRWETMRIAYKAGEEIAHQAGLLGDPIWAILRGVAIGGEMHAGNLPRVEQMATAYLAEARRRGNVGELSLPLSLLAAVFLSQGRTGAGTAAVRESLETSPRSPLGLARFYAELIAATALMVEGRGEQSLTEMLRLRARVRSKGVVFTNLEEASMRVSVVRAKLFIRCRNRAASGRIRLHLGRGPFPPNFSEDLLRFRAALAYRRGRRRRALALLDRSVAQAARHNNPWTLALGLAARSVVRVSLGAPGAELDRERAREKLAAIGASDTPLLWLEGWSDTSE